MSRREPREDGERKHRDRRTLRRAAAKRKHQALEPAKMPDLITHPVRR